MENSSRFDASPEILEKIQKDKQDRALLIETTANEIVKVKAIFEAVKPLYDTLDTLTLQLKGLLEAQRESEVFIKEEQMIVFQGRALVIPPQFVEVTDNFLEKNTVFRTAGVKRFEAKTELLEERQQRLVKEAKKAAKALKA